MTELTPLEQILAFARERGDAFPRVAVLIADCPGLPAFEATLARIPPPLRDVPASVYAYFDLPAERLRELGGELARRTGWEKAALLRAVRDYGYGGNRKVALCCALEQGFDFVAVLPATQPGAPQSAIRGSTELAEVNPQSTIPDDTLARLLVPALIGGAALVHSASPRPEPPGLAERLTTRLTDFVLNLRLTDWRPGPRLYRLSALRRVPFMLNDDGPLFDAQLLIQIKSLGERIAEAPLAEPKPRIEAASPLAAALEYRLHQLHLRRHGRWLVDRAANYTFKKSPLSSHGQLLGLVPSGARVLDLGCSQGLLAHELEKKGCRVVGVDRLPPEQVKLPYERYHQINLDDEFTLPYDREFDVVILSDVIEHLRRRELVMAAVRRHLREDGRLIVSTGNVAIWFYRLSLALGRFEYGPRGILDETHVRLFTRSTFERLVRQAGFEIVRRIVTPLPFELIFETRADAGFIRFLDRTYHACARAWPSMFAYQFILEARIARLEPGEAPGWPPGGDGA